MAQCENAPAQPDAAQTPRPDAAACVPADSTVIREDLEAFRKAFEQAGPRAGAIPARKRKQLAARLDAILARLCSVRTR